jgi:hypothetical protein
MTLSASVMKVQIGADKKLSDDIEIHDDVRVLREPARRARAPGRSPVRGPFRIGATSPAIDARAGSSRGFTAGDCGPGTGGVRTN